MSQDEFQSIIVDTKDVVKELKAICSTYKLKPQDIDFNILECHTFFRTSEDEEWEELNDKNREMFESDEFLVHENLQINQNYKIEIFKIDLQKHANDKLPTITLGANKTLTNIIATIKKDLDLSTKGGMDKKIISQINKKKLKAGILIGIKESDMLKEVSRVAASIQVNGFLENDESFMVMDFLKPVFSINDDMIYHYQKKVKKEDEQGRINYARRGFVLPVEEGEVIIEYIKPQMGTPGRNCRGKFIPIKEPSQTQNVTINTTDAIVVQEDDNSIKYVSTKKGYVKDDGGVYDIQDQMDVDGVKFKTTGSIEAGIDSNVTINIKETMEFEDAIGAGMKVETTAVNVEGSVGSNAFIKANDVKIGGQTHKNSTIDCKNIDVTVHRGKITSDIANIDRLEGGEVVADSVHVQTVVGGTIIAREIHVDTLISNATIISSELVDVKNIKGSNNKIIIDPTQIKGIENKINEISEKISNAEDEYKKIPKLLKTKKEIIESNKNAVEAVKERLLELKAKNIKPFAGLTKKVIDYQNLVKEYNSCLNDYKDKQEKIKELKRDLNEFQSKVFSAKIISHSPWTEFNEICFKLIYPPVEVVHSTRENEMSREITLEQIAEDKYEIKRSTEFSS